LEKTVGNSGGVLDVHSSVSVLAVELAIDDWTVVLVEAGLAVVVLIVLVALVVVGVLGIEDEDEEEEETEGLELVSDPGVTAEVVVEPDTTEPLVPVLDTRYAPEKTMMSAASASARITVLAAGFLFLITRLSLAYRVRWGISSLLSSSS
jgi:hypothetical protein